MELTKQTTVLDEIEADNLDFPNPIRSLSSKLVSTQLNFISKTYRFEYNEINRLNNISAARVLFENDEENIPICKKIDQHLERQTLHITPEIIKFASQTHQYDEMSNEAKMRLCVARIEVLHLELQMERNDLVKAASKVPPEKVREIVCSICLEEVHPSYNKTITFICGHIYCDSCILKDVSDVCAVCTARKNPLEITEIKFRFNLEYKPICRFCLIPFTEESDITFLRCGHVYCETCIHKLDAICICGRFLNKFNVCNTLFPRFN